MLKYILGFTMILSLTACMSSSDEADSLKRDLRGSREANDILQSELNTCRAKLEYSGNSSSQQEVQEEPQKPAEPEYEEVRVYEVDGTKCYETDAEDTAPACGRSFWQCKDGVLRECMTNVKYKISKERKLVEEE